MDDSVVEESAPATAPASSQAGALRDDQVQNAVQFLLHPKVQASTMDERKKFLQKKGLTEEEIEEAVRIAQPKLDQVSRSQAAAKSTSNTQQANIKTSQSQPNMLSSASPSRGSQGNELQSSSSTQSSWGKILLASMAVVGLGSGLGVLAKKYTKEHLADLWGTTDNGRSVRERKNVEHDERLREISSSIHKLHEAVDRNIKEVSDMNRRLIALESAPSLDHVKTEILNTTQNMITSNSLSELQQEVKSLRTLMLNIATQNGGNGPEDKKSEAAAPPMAKVIDQVEVKPSSSAEIWQMLEKWDKQRQVLEVPRAAQRAKVNLSIRSEYSQNAAMSADDEQISCADSQTKQDDTSAVETNFKEVLDLVQVHYLSFYVQN
ncbi:hypothetical protein GUITHDRAFT_114363 [Guillardia theta CCMP2712]|uniref:Peroxisomal membrane protein PEX14 n=1 Tax=Guillardia theta (strain CCMP2712) TaxID=905079 RepID=L1ITP7_GUITC|nr:hypothetical protein GUITHDRAFT_114363 [Guillardia theta CCMP2712]EKX39636.1 hypothetical protein GUITHDRAFT_114363 [Guillardia theta CCMP2712]|eukprot:XP_005826616.1 hypothetical protein GUITHDRAFT_114363 [Guillardia theta CCMP2712]